MVDIDAKRGHSILMVWYSMLEASFIPTKLLLGPKAFHYAAFLVDDLRG